MMNVHATIVSLVLTVLLTVGCAHLVFSDKGVETSLEHEEHELAVAGTRRRATTPAPEPASVSVPLRAAGAESPRSSEWVAVPAQANASNAANAANAANASTPAMPPPGPAPVGHSRGTAGATNRSRPESAGRASAV